MIPAIKRLRHTLGHFETSSNRQQTEKWIEKEKSKVLYLTAQGSELRIATTQGNFYDDKKERFSSANGRGHRESLTMTEQVRSSSFQDRIGHHTQASRRQARGNYPICWRRLVGLEFLAAEP